MTFEANNLQPVARHPVTGNTLWLYITTADTSDEVGADQYFDATDTGIQVNDSILVKATDIAVLLSVSAIAVGGEVTTAQTTLSPLGITLDPENPIEPDIGGNATVTTLQRELELLHSRLNLKVQSFDNIGVGVGMFIQNDTETDPTNKQAQFRKIQAGDGIAVIIDDDGSLIISQDGAGGGGGGGATDPNDVSRNVAAVLHAFSGSVSDFGDNGVDGWTLNLNFPEPTEHAHTRANESSSPAPFAGSRSMRTEIRPGDRQWLQGDSRSDKRRAEYSWRPERFPAGTNGTNIPEGWYGAAFYLPSDPMADINGCAIFQLHNHPDPGVLWNLFCFGGRLISTNDAPSGDVDLLNLDITPFLDRWNRMVVNFKPSTGSNGFIRLFLNETQVINRTGANKPSGVQGPYAKHGAYFWGYERQDFGLEANVLHDNLTIANENGSFDLVDPRTFPRTD